MILVSFATNLLLRVLLLRNSLNDSLGSVGCAVVVLVWLIWFCFCFFPFQFFRYLLLPGKKNALFPGFYLVL